MMIGVKSLRTILFVKSLNLKEKLTGLVDIPVPFIPDTKYRHYISRVPYSLFG